MVSAPPASHKWNEGRRIAGATGCYTLKGSQRLPSGARRSPSRAPSSVGEWLSLVEHLVRDQGVGGSNPLSPTIILLVTFSSLLLSIRELDAGTNA
jgi:hypothetical protein